MTAMAERPATGGSGTRAAAQAVMAETTLSKAARYVFAGIRLALGWVFLWAFLDKTFGLGHETESANAG